MLFNKTEDQSISKNEENEIKINLEKEPEKQKPIVEDRVEQIAESNVVKNEKRKRNLQIFNYHLFHF